MLAFVVAGMLRRKRVATGRDRAAWPFVLLALLAPPLLAVLILQPDLVVNWPERGRFRITGGVQVTPEFTALLVGLGLSASAGIAEIVRAGILSVGRGQWEASRAVGLRDRQTMRLVVLPQALRVIVPPLTSSYLSTFKNSSLAIAIGYPDLVMVSNTTMNQTGQAIEGIAIFMLVYLEHVDRDLAVHELVQCARRAGGALRWPPSPRWTRSTWPARRCRRAAAAACPPRSSAISARR